MLIMKSQHTLLTALLLAQLAELHAKRNVPDFPKFGKRRGENFQPLESIVVTVSNDWN
jgi:hypothetical protein